MAIVGASGSGYVTARSVPREQLTHHFLIHIERALCESNMMAVKSPRAQLLRCVPSVQLVERFYDVESGHIIVSSKSCFSALLDG